MTNKLSKSISSFISKYYDSIALYKPYMDLARLDRPIGWFLLLIPGWWAIALAGGGFAGMGFWDYYVAFLFLIGAIVMRAAGCAVNDIWDRNFDAQVERTRSRPLADGTLTVPQAIVFTGALLLIGFAILIQLGGTAIVLGFLSLPLIFVYPLMKRITFWPQAFLGITFNMGALIGWAAITGFVEFSAMLLYLAGLFWTLGYDTIYAHQDKEDDALAGIKSTALLLGDQSKLFIGGFYLTSWVLLMLALV
ncbi:MAG TPA: 4-hydroxybenzoate octaprenyltransferase, partial [Alphaproteobacteria bacterium]|nr:4-hydroxybenzoate octaprenyltransferase [Alphaproteobacteria bacterium]